MPTKAEEATELATSLHNLLSKRDEELSKSQALNSALGALVFAMLDEHEERDSWHLCGCDWCYQARSLMVGIE